MHMQFSPAYPNHVQQYMSWQVQRNGIQCVEIIIEASLPITLRMRNNHVYAYVP